MVSCLTTTWLPAADVMPHSCSQDCQFCCAVSTNSTALAPTLAGTITVYVMVTGVAIIPAMLSASPSWIWSPLTVHPMLVVCEQNRHHAHHLLCSSTLQQQLQEVAPRTTTAVVQVGRKWAQSGSDGGDDKPDRLDFSERPSAASGTSDVEVPNGYGSTTDLTLKSRVDVEDDDDSSDSDGTRRSLGALDVIASAASVSAPRFPQKACHTHTQCPTALHVSNVCMLCRIWQLMNGESGVQMRMRCPPAARMACRRRLRPAGACCRPLCATWVSTWWAALLWLARTFSLPSPSLSAS